MKSCIKKPFINELEIEKFLKLLRKTMSKTKQEPTYNYICPNCGMWHYSRSSPERELEFAKKKKKKIKNIVGKLFVYLR